jgi:leader peptidase (prepilin peptidase)/N-methyltransferase
MGTNAIFDSRNWAAVPFHFWTVVFFTFGCIVGSFLNVVIHRLPLGQSVVSPPSHCPHCQYSIPWYLNIPLATWLYLGGKCRNCGAPIAVRYFLVELLTGVLFAACWIAFGPHSVFVALVYCIFLAGLIAGTFIDAEHMIVPNEITYGGMVAGFVFSFLLPQLQGKQTLTASMIQSGLGIGAGIGIIYGIVRLGKLVWGRQRVTLPGETRIVFSEHCVHLPDGDVAYEDLFYRRTDAIRLKARTVELADRCYKDVSVRLSPEKLEIGDEQLNPEEVPHLEAVTSEVILPREAMGFGDVTFMGAIGAFLGWHAVIFTLMASSLIGSVVGITLIVRGRRSTRLAYVPFIAIAAAIWVFLPEQVHQWWTWNLRMMGYLFFRIPLPPSGAMD